MLTSNNTSALYDVLSITAKLEKVYGNARSPEIEFIAYLSCILFLYRGGTATDWEYKFASTKHGYPACANLQEAMLQLSTAGHLKKAGNYFTLTSRGEDAYSFQLELSRFKKRERAIQGATDALMLIPLGIMRGALFNEASKNAFLASSLSKRLLLNDDDMDFIYSSFGNISKEIGDPHVDLMLPATLWIKHLQVEPA